MQSKLNEKSHVLPCISPKNLNFFLLFNTLQCVHQLLQAQTIIEQKIIQFVWRDRRPYTFTGLLIYSTLHHELAIF